MWKLIRQTIELPFLPIKYLFLGMLRLYKKILSPLLPPACRFTPTCSEYFYEALVRKGLFHGTILGVYRLLRCQPFSKGGYDPVDLDQPPLGIPGAEDPTKSKNNPYLKEDLDLSPSGDSKSGDEEKVSNS